MNRDRSNGLELKEAIARTERGALWRATRNRPNDRIVRIINPQFCDTRFRQSLTRLREHPPARMLPIVGEGWFGPHFYIEYRLDSPWETLEERFAHLHWRRRLAVITEICQVLPQWRQSPIHPLGINGCNIIMAQDAGRWFPWLLPCPSPRYASPCDLFGCDSPVISFVAPEAIRGVSLNEQVQDSYALGALALRALGCKESPVATTDEDRVEAQARGSLMDGDISSVEQFLQGLKSSERFLQVVHHYAQVSPQARPIEAQEMQEACVTILNATDPLEMASELVRRKNSREALSILEWGFRTFGESLPGRIMAADICEKIEETHLALEHLHRAVVLNPDDYDLRWRRCSIGCIYYQTLPPFDPQQKDPLGDLLLDELAWFDGRTDEVSAVSVPRNLPQKYMALVFRRRGNLPNAAEALRNSAEAEQSDMATLYEYAECLHEMQAQGELATTVRIAKSRVQQMADAELITKSAAELWKQSFEDLLKP